MLLSFLQPKESQKITECLNVPFEKIPFSLSYMYLVKSVISISDLCNIVYLIASLWRTLSIHLHVYFPQYFDVSRVTLYVFPRK